MDSTNENNNEKNDLSKSTLVAKCVMKSITHPLDYARFLVQVSHYQLPIYLFWM